MRRGPVRAACALLAALSLAGVPGAARAGYKTHTVQIKLPVEARLDTTGIRRVLVGGFLVSDDARFDVQEELVRLMRQTLERHTDLLILPDPPTSLPEQRLEELKENAPFFQAVGADYRSDLIVTGRVIYDTRDQSGFVSEEVISPTTGRRTLRTRYLERTGYSLQLDLVLVGGEDGEVLYETTFYQDDIFTGDSIDSLSVFHQLAEGFREGFLSIFIPRERLESRYLFAE